MNESGEADPLIQSKDLAWNLANTTGDVEEDFYLGTKDVEQWQLEETRCLYDTYHHSWTFGGCLACVLYNPLVPGLTEDP